MNEYHSTYRGWDIWSAEDCEGRRIYRRSKPQHGMRFDPGSTTGIYSLAAIRELIREDILREDEVRQ